MRKLITLAVALLFAGCGPFPRYAISPGPSPAGTTTTKVVQVEWPDLSKWDKGSVGPNDVAVIVAIEDYAFLPDVPGAVENANDWEQYLKVHRGARKVYMLTNAQATSEEILRFVKQAAAETTKDGKLWFVFIGHGAPTKDASDGLLVAMDAQQTINSIQTRSIQRAELIQALEAGQQQQTVVLLDTCFSGKSPSGELLAKGTQPVIAVAPVMKNAALGTVVLTAAAGNEVAGQLPGTERPAFTYLMLGAVRGWAGTEGNINAETALNYVKAQFRYLKGRQQTPGMEGNGQVLLGVNSSAEDPGVAALMKGEGTRTVTVTSPAAASAPRHGLAFEVPRGWNEIVNSMEYDPSIGVALQSMVGKSVMVGGTAYGNMTADEADVTWRVREKAEIVTFGTADGALSHYSETMQGFESEIYIFQTQQNGQFWRFMLQVEDRTYEQEHLRDFHSFLESVKYPQAQ